MIFRCGRVVLFGTWFGDARDIAELDQHSSSSVLRAGTEALGIVKPEISVIYGEYLVSLLCDKDEKVHRAAVAGI